MIEGLQEDFMKFKAEIKTKVDPLYIKEGLLAVSEIDIKKAFDLIQRLRTKQTSKKTI